MLGSMSLASIEATKQLDRIVALGSPDAADMTSDSFRALARPPILALEYIFPFSVHDRVPPQILRYRHYTAPQGHLTADLTAILVWHICFGKKRWDFLPSSVQVFADFFKNRLSGY